MGYIFLRFCNKVNEILIKKPYTFCKVLPFTTPRLIHSGYYRILYPRSDRRSGNH